MSVTHYLLKLFLLVMGFFMLQNSASATHLMGGETKYVYLGALGSPSTPFRYRVTFDIYYNCPGSGVASPPNSITVSFWDKTTGAWIKNVNYSNNITPQPISAPLPPGCVIPGLQSCIILKRFEGIVDLPLSFDGYYATYYQGNRNNGINNLANSGGQYQTFYIEMSPPLLQNSSPAFADTAVAVMCQGDTLTIFNTAVDPDGDRLIYSFKTPYSQVINGSFGNTFAPPPSPVNYASNYSFANPFGPGGFASINGSTGTTRYYSPTTGNFVLSFEVKEYRKFGEIEIEVGSTRREIQLLVASCPPNPIPTFTSLSSSGTTVYTIEEGDQLSVNFGLTDASVPAQQVLLVAESSLLDSIGGYNASFNGSQMNKSFIQGTGSLTSNFQFTSRCGEAGTYFVRLRAQDFGCPPKQNSHTLQINVTTFQGPQQIFGEDTICSGNLTQTYHISGTSASSYNWSVTNGTI
ncbi:MAG: hypothetical protein LPJ89_11575, partial [Hymenobacteraceae bacterium]|nr:hypothetical protein [Hymenobacteraceae bacterium]